MKPGKNHDLLHVGQGGLVNRFWHRALRRRSQKGKYLSRERMQRLIQTWIPPAKLLHPYPNQRLRVIYPR